MTNIKEIIAAMQTAYNNGYTSFGVRTGENVKIGQELECSHDWDYENDCESEDFLNGTCATGFGYLWFDGEREDEEAVVKAIEHNAKCYAGEMQYIIAGNSEDYGADDKEVIIESAVVIAVVK